MAENIILQKSFAFALRIVKLYKYLCEEKGEFVISKQLLIAGTHIGKHVKEAAAAENKLISTNEMNVALRKTSETEYWLELLFQAKYLEEKQFDSINNDRTEVEKLLISIVKTAKSGATENI